MIKTSIKIIAFVTMLYVLIAATLYVMQRSLIYHGSPITNPTPQNVTPITITTSDGLSLTSWYIQTSTANAPTIVHFHGNVGNIEWRFKKLLPFVPAGYNLLLTGYRGYGGNPGKPTEQGLYKDARAAINWLKTTHNTPENKMVFYGESLGSGIATQMATEYNEAALILEAPYTSLPDAARQTYFFLPLNWLMKDHYNNISKISAINSPLYIIHGDKDLVISSKQGQLLFDAAQTPKTILRIPEASHNNLYDYEAPLHILDFLSTIETLRNNSNQN